jgi:hypothetical protein
MQVNTADRCSRETRSQCGGVTTQPYPFQDFFSHAQQNVVFALLETTETLMKTKAGLWIDHAKAVIVTVTDKAEEIRLVRSNVEKQLRRSGGSVSTTSYDPQHVPADDARERDYTRQLNFYYDEVISRIRAAEFVLIFGPGEAKGELQKRMEKNKPSGRIVGMETADKMTKRQIAAKVRQYFLKQHSTMGSR